MPAPDFLSADYLRDPYAMHRVMRDEYPLYFHEPTSSYVISRYGDVAGALKDPRFSNKVYEWQLKDVYPDRTIVQMDGREHASYRNIVAPALREQDLRARCMHVLNEDARILIDAFRHRGEVDLVQEFTSCYPIHVTVDLLGLPKSDAASFQRWYQGLVHLITNLEQNPIVIEEGVRAREELCTYLRPLIARRRAEPREDLLSAIATAEIEGKLLSEAEVQSFVALLLVGGGETLDNGLGLFFKNLLAHPDVFEEVRADRRLITPAFAESLRYTPPVHLVMRLTVEDVEVTGGKIPKGSLVACMIAAANRDEREFPAPNEFDIHRDGAALSRAFTASAKHLAFGSGRHFCAGAALAKLEVEVAVGQLLDAMKKIAFLDGVPPPDSNYFIRGPRTLRLMFAPSTPPS
jgi:cytochrome P450